MVNAVVLLPWATLKVSDTRLDLSFTPQGQGPFLVGGCVLAFALGTVQFYRRSVRTAALKVLVAASLIVVAITTAFGAIHAANQASSAGLQQTSYALGASLGVGAAWLLAVTSIVTFVSLRAPRRRIESRAREGTAS